MTGDVRGLDVHQYEVVLVQGAEGAFHLKKQVRMDRTVAVSGQRINIEPADLADALHQSDAGDACRGYAVLLRERLDGRTSSGSAGEQDVGRRQSRRNALPVGRMGFQDSPALLHERVDHIRGEPGLLCPSDAFRYVRLPSGIDVGDIRGQAVPSQQQERAVLGAGPDDAFDAVDDHPVHCFCQFCGLRSAYPSGPAVHDLHVLVHRGEVASEGHVPGLHVESRTHGLQRPPARIHLLGIVPQKGEMGGVATGPDAGGYGVAES